MDVDYQDFGEVTTPQLHYLVAQHVKQPKAFDYIENFARAFVTFCELTGKPKPGYEPQFVLDCANGVGFFTFTGVLNFVSQYLKPSLINTRVETKKLVNHECGAEFVQKDIQYPTEYDLNSSPTKGCSFDGDADRLIYFRKGTGKNERVDVIDGDKQFALIMMYVRELLE